MGNFVNIRTSVPDLLGIANQLRSQADGLTGELDSALAAVNRLDVPATFPPDSFTNEFTGSYHQPVETGSGQTLPANDAIKQGAREVSEALSGIADHVTNAMLGYQSTDENNAAEINEEGGGASGT